MAVAMSVDGTPNGLRVSRRLEGTALIDRDGFLWLLDDKLPRSSRSATHACWAQPGSIIQWRTSRLLGLHACGIYLYLDDLFVLKPVNIVRHASPGSILKIIWFSGACRGCP